MNEGVCIVKREKRRRKIASVIFILIVVIILFNVNNGKKASAHYNLKELKTNNTNTKITEYAESSEQLNNIAVDNNNERENILSTVSDSVMEEFYEVEYNNIIQAYEQFNIFNFENKKVVLNDGISDYEADVKVDVYESGYDTKCVISTETKYGTEIIREIVDVEENKVPTRKKWFKLQTYEHPKIKPYGPRKFEFKDKSKIRELNAYGVVSTFGYTISENGLVSRYIDGKITNEGAQSHWGDDIYKVSNVVTVGKAKLFPDVMQMCVLQKVVEYERYDAK